MTLKAKSYQMMQFPPATPGDSHSGDQLQGTVILRTSHHADAPLRPSQQPDQVQTCTNILGHSSPGLWIFQERGIPDFVEWLCPHAGSSWCGNSTPTSTKIL